MNSEGVNLCGVPLISPRLSGPRGYYPSSGAAPAGSKPPCQATTGHHNHMEYGPESNELQDQGSSTDIYTMRACVVRLQKELRQWLLQDGQGIVQGQGLRGPSAVLTTAFTPPRKTQGNTATATTHGRTSSADGWAFLAGRIKTDRGLAK
ncbi:unnamed protein product [Gadus morhua 'NCC']